MALNSSGLASELADLFKLQYSSTAIIGTQMAISISNYFETGLAPGNGIVTTAQGISILASEITDAFDLQASSENIPASLIGNAIDIMLSSAIIIGVPYGTGPISGMAVSALISDFTSIWEAQYSSEDVVGQEMANTINNYTISGICNGSGVPPDFTPQIGPLS